MYPEIRSTVTLLIAPVLLAIPSDGSRSRPYITLTYAQSLDGCIAGKGGTQVLLSGRESMIMTHWLRTMHDGILVGVNTIRNDDPQLNTRHLPPRSPSYPQPRPIVLDTSLGTPPSCKLLHNYQNKTGRQPWIVCAQRPLRDGSTVTTDLWWERRHALESAGARVIEVSSEDDKVNIQAALGALRRLGIQSLMIEGGATVIAAFMKLQDQDETPTVDMHIVTVAPKIIGSSGLKATNTDAQPPHLEPIGAAIFGTDAAFASRLLRPSGLSPT
ncbi:dihydrofolate reductase-like domain-containing protein [Cantharellus anzutake]|uniref:dihydrofolate reductase-like domain-containing protein n=1 Tax=Cantharellus anzutake TaxID=1750568 RepID=UPI0019056625|nr:dihydrofolate reductase-like domain-containing protein [Cantharellus anzutake]KAF8336501.1 dihydrofolate reductase-like domain-containing protein [Cantharellus anzutake]